jgi:hypothetical protein
VALALCAGLSSATAVLAQESATPAPSWPAIVFVRVDPAAPGAASLAGVEAQLGELNVRVLSAAPMQRLTLASQAFRAAGLASAQQALGTIWLEHTAEAQLRVYVYDAKHRQLSSRTLARPDAAVREELAVVLRSAITALMAGEATTLEPVALPAPATQPAAARPVLAPPRWQRLIGGVAYTGTTYASGSYQSGVELLLAARLTPRFLLGIDASWSQPVRISAAGASASLHRYPAEVWAALAFAESARFHALCEAGLQLEGVLRTTRVSDPSLQATPAAWRIRLAAVPRLRAMFEPQPGQLLFAAFGADITTDRYDYVVQSASGPVRLTSRTVRPRLEAGVAVRFW